MCSSGKCISITDSEGFNDYKCECDPGYEGVDCGIGTYVCVLVCVYVCVCL